MFARSAIRITRPLRQQVRAFASESPNAVPKSPEQAPKPSSNSALYAAGAAALAIGGYYLSNGNGAKASAAAPVEIKKAFTGGPQGFLSLEVSDVKDLSSNTKLLRFKLPDSESVSGVVFTSAVLTKFKPEGAEKAVIRPYTPTSDEDSKGYMDLVVKKYPDGPMSSHIHNLKPGDKLDIKGPLPKYPWSANKHPEIALIAGGTGITPMYQLLRGIFSNPEDKTKVTLIFGNVTEDDILLKAELDKLENTYPQRFRAFYLLDKPSSSWKGGKGFVTKELLKTTLPEPKQENIKVFVCGPPGLMNAVSGNKVSPKDQGELKGALKELGYTAEQVYKF
ncbi:NADH-cytochrome b5 reductase 2 [Ceratocystis lukuohia]|uniref:NADH-cytochrome b5 reductase n=3 Tax=Ceratocystis TaxID=5157 RepID=A0A0F8DJT3_CERFI|nr:NADH-cytochrome b5 reductase 2 [Ceratocystis platani]PHH50817.1 NADH-cytochrome b5 reductase 2 [Ceratocystis fimbriata CBS 114723]